MGGWRSSFRTKLIDLHTISYTHRYLHTHIHTHTHTHALSIGQRSRLWKQVVEHGSDLGSAPMPLAYHATLVHHEQLEFKVQTQCATAHVRARAGSEDPRLRASTIYSLPDHLLRLQCCVVTTNSDIMRARKCSCTRNDHFHAAV